MTAKPEHIISEPPNHLQELGDAVQYRTQLIGAWRSPVERACMGCKRSEVRILSPRQPMYRRILMLKASDK